MCTVFKQCFLSSRFTSLFTKPIVHSILILLLIKNLIRFSVKMTLFLKRLHVWETRDIFLALASPSDLHFTCQTVSQTSTFKIPGESSVGEWQWCGTFFFRKALQKTYSFYFYIFPFFFPLLKPVSLSYFGCLGKNFMFLMCFGAVQF